MGSKFTGEHPCQGVISRKLQSNFIEITLRHGCSLAKLEYLFSTHFYKSTTGGLLLESRKLLSTVENGSRTIAPEENCPPTLKLTLTLTLTRGAIFLGAIVRIL